MNSIRVIMRAQAKQQTIDKSNKMKQKKDKKFTKQQNKKTR